MDTHLPQNYQKTVLPHDFRIMFEILPRGIRPEYFVMCFFILLINWAQKYWQIRVGLIGLRIDQFIMVSQLKVQVTCHCGDGLQFELKTPARQLLLPWISESLCDV